MPREYAGMRIPTPEEVDRLRQRYEGLRVKVIEMPADPAPVEPGTEGTVELVDGMGQLCVLWDNGSTLSLIPGVDKFEVLPFSR